ncbi:MAG: hypothetical protein AAF211_20400 [Myxococcota bacterium]
MSPWLALARADAVNLGRDPLLLTASIVALPVGLLVRLTRAPLAEALAVYVPPADLDALLGSFVLVLPAMLAGTVQGFLRLEERDEHVEAAVQVSPVGLPGLWRWRLGSSTALALVTSALAWALAGLPASLGLPLALLIAGLHGPAIALVLARARDKVQGLALAKLTSLASVAQVALLLPGAAAWIGSPFPGWWLARGLGSDDIGALTIGASLSGVICATLVAWRQPGR